MGSIVFHEYMIASHAAGMNEHVFSIGGKFVAIATARLRAHSPPSLKPPTNLGPRKGGREGGRRAPHTAREHPGTRAGPQPPHAGPGREERKNAAHTRGATTLPQSPTHNVYYCVATRAYSPYDGTRPTLDTNTLMLSNSAHEMWCLPNVQHPFQVSGWARSGGDPEIDSMMLVSLDGSGRSPFLSLAYGCDLVLINPGVITT